MTHVIAFLGRTFAELRRVPPFAEWQVVRTVRSDPSPEVQYKFDGHGVEVLCDGLDDRIRTVFLFRGGDGESLIDVPFASSREQVLMRYGPPERSGGPSRIPILGDSGPWDRFALPEGTVHVQYAIERDEIELITLMRADVVP